MHLRCSFSLFPVSTYLTCATAGALKADLSQLDYHDAMKQTGQEQGIVIGTERIITNRIIRRRLS